MNEALLRHAAGQCLARGVRSVEVRVGEARGSVPRGDGTRMLVSADAVLGTIGGGHLEWQAIATARRLLATPAFAPLTQTIALGPTLGQCCGGALSLHFAAFDADALARWPAPAPQFTLQLYGAGHVGRAIARLLEGLHCRVQWIDEREDEFPGEASAPHIERLCVEPVEAEVRAAPHGCYYLVLTHSHDLDQRITEAILQRGDFGYLGLIGSATKRARFLHRFEQRGIPAEVLARLTCPIGVPGIGGKEPELIAIAVVAQLLQQQHAV
ncbi:xanthine dehydrogenase accessory protein XdhC [Aquabacterium sp.]|uniref:xanthine dehydrogenase accessory protein XdhC n=1 Tax=Aquabacterium sp. TaxID=1872578 RepID=UPI002B9714E2|nr:xanthine dehydrogenase accessory protein XdhC [Aquabacterium sp.]HSW05470.1 xanthine dehydrogenase accessory protein XdhC [Aquabacterium sp.]